MKQRELGDPEDAYREDDVADADDIAEPWKWDDIGEWPKGGSVRRPLASRECVIHVAFGDPGRPRRRY